MGTPEKPHRYGRKTTTVTRRWFDEKGKLHQDLLITTLLELDRDEIAKLYDLRGGMEVDIKADKRGLSLEERRKKNFNAQEALVLLAQLAHNLLTWFKRWFLEGTSAAGLGMERLVKEVMAMPAQVGGGSSGGRLRLSLPTLHPWAKALGGRINAYFR